MAITMRPKPVRAAKREIKLDPGPQNGNGQHDFPMLGAAEKSIAIGRATNGAAIAPDAEASADGIYLVQQIALEHVQIDSGHNPRTEFDKEKHEELTASVREHGILQPILVRPDVGGAAFVLVAGERRFRAARAAGLETVPCVVRELDERQAKELAIVENLQRDDLNVLDEAQAFADLIELGVSQADLARRLGCNPSHVSNRLRLLKLPKALKARVVSQEITPTQARELLPLCEYPSLAKHINEVLERVAKWEGLPLGKEQWEETLDYDILNEGCWRVDHAGVVDNVAVPPLELTDEQRRQLEVFVHNKQEYAANATLFEKLWNAHAKAFVAVHAEKATKKKGKGATAKGGKSAKGKKPTASQLKAKAEKQATETARRVAHVKHDWFCYLIAGAVAKCKDLATLTKLALTLHAEPENVGAGVLWGKPEKLDAEVDPVRMDQSSNYRRVHGCSRDYDERNTPVWRKLKPLTGVSFNKSVAEWCAAHFYAADRAWHAADYDLLPVLMKEFSIDEKAAWKSEKLGPYTQRYYELHTTDQLTALAAELGVHLESSKPKAIKVQILMGAAFPPYPKELAAAEVK